uniref:Uncharacterized protein n=1 Tax=Cannabis sativa TaxID=3483 RepID=A0A803QGZ5_CANSA
MADEELVAFVRSMMSSMELRMEQHFKAQLKELDAMFECYCPSTKALPDSSSQAPSTSSENDDHVRNSVEPVRVAIPLEITPATTHIIGDSPSINIVGD